ncbi:hypothetical protein BST27_18045 [Mycobacterium intermedium]|uniref:Acyl-CoA carboxylase subunit epsilon n=1 Tax=Mycobacterium intermedium TaxID=28445 RepID=A0A1E3SB78_MYCIE|nr:acyl-CoA carboxylase subunit epsilon [Mycobacterium intermedium]ODQ99416.1 hypothetical protein BHQ20_18065 [Mycobacterium intermedium]OPE45730.1 hypothetical protein BV508_28575 [Mycobacterium intermedium]ORB00871.1 hypothetical protein BST27_18045 [Mycobacterium intermedium]
MTDAAAESTGAAAEKPAESEQHHEPHLEILKGHPTDQELAALVAVLGSIGGPPPPPPPEPSRWGLPVDRLRYPVFSWQRITLQEMTHMRR